MQFIKLHYMKVKLSMRDCRMFYLNCCIRASILTPYAKVKGCSCSTLHKAAPLLLGHNF